MQVIRRDDFGWVTALIAGRYVVAKVYDKPSYMGVHAGRVSKLDIGKGDRIKYGKPYYAQLCYSYERELNFDEAPPGLVDRVVWELEELIPLGPYRSPYRFLFLAANQGQKPPSPQDDDPF